MLLVLLLAAFGGGRARADQAPSPSLAPAAAVPAPAATVPAVPAPSSAPESAAAQGADPALAAPDAATPAAPAKEDSPAASGKESLPAPSAKEALPAAPGEKSETAASAGQASAAAPPSSQAASATLKSLTEAGVRLYERGDFAGAIQAFSAGYALRPKPVFLFNIAQAYRKSGQDQSALSFYGKFIAASPQSPYRAEAEAYIAYLRGKLGLDRPPPRPPRVYKKGWFWAVLSTAAVTAGVAVTLGIVLGTRDPPTTLGTVEPRFR